MNRNEVEWTRINRNDTGMDRSDTGMDRNDTGMNRDDTGMNLKGQILDFGAEDRS